MLDVNPGDRIMDILEKARERLLEELENVEWDLSEEGLDIVARRLKEYFSNFNEAREFVEEHASYLFKLMEEEQGSDPY